MNGDIWVAGAKGATAHYGSTASYYVGLNAVKLALPRTYLDFTIFAGVADVLGLSTSGGMYRWGTSASETIYAEGFSSYSNTTFVKIMAGHAQSYVLVSDDGTYWTYSPLVTSVQSLMSNSGVQPANGEDTGSALFKSRSPWPWISCSNSTYVPANGYGVP